MLMKMRKRTRSHHLLTLWIGRASDEEKEGPIVWPELQGGRKILRRKEAQGSVLRLPSLMMAISMPNAASIPVHDNDNGSGVGDTGPRPFAVPTAVGLSVGRPYGRRRSKRAPTKKLPRPPPPRCSRPALSYIAPCLSSGSNASLVEGGSRKIRMMKPWTNK